MTLSARDVVNRQFPQAFRGYDQGAVDSFLDQVAETLQTLNAERERMVEQLRIAGDRAKEQGEAERLLRRTLVAAQRTADDTVAEARQTAEQTLASARANAERIRAEAAEDAERIRDEATRRSAELAAALRGKLDEDQEEVRVGVERFRAAIEELRAFRGEYRDRVRLVIAEQLELLDRAGEPPALPAALEAFAAAGPGAGTPEAAAIAPEPVELAKPEPAPVVHGASPASVWADRSGR